MKHFSYATILRQRLVVAGLTLGLIAVMIGVGIDIYISNNRTTIPSSTRALTEPLDPQLDVDTVLRLESYETVTVESARAFVRQHLQQLQRDLEQEEAEVQEALQELGLPGLAEGAESSQDTQDAEDTTSPFLLEEEIPTDGSDAPTTDADGV